MTYNRTVHETVAALRLVRDKWGDLNAAIGEPPTPADWPPVETSDFVNKTATLEGPLLVEDRAPLTLRPYSAPINVTAHDAVVAVETALFDLADTLAAVTQEHTPLDELHRWNYRTQHGPGSRAQGAHWAAVFVEGRVLGEFTGDGQQADGRLGEPLFAPLPEHLLHEAHRVARQCARRVLGALRHDERAAPGRRPCPWCEGPLVLHSAEGEVQRITCSTGPSCSAPVPLDLDGHRVWERENMGGLLAVFAAQPDSERTCAVICS
ncbi:hypothetical protein [Streptomyces sp. cg36]|uniref:hypothetical protein n=1 Tax=Streptomyces sp. cg36 TaxID=3238798 RepID=UPI0034E2A718